MRRRGRRPPRYQERDSPEVEREKEFVRLLFILLFQFLGPLSIYSGSRLKEKAFGKRFYSRLMYDFSAL